MARYRLTKKQIANGAYEGVLQVRAAGPTPPALELLCLGEVVGDAVLEPIDDKGERWLVRAEIPRRFLVDGVHTFLIVPAGRTEILDRFSLVVGEPLEEDLRAEIELLRAELDMLKSAFRRHCAETMR